MDDILLRETNLIGKVLEAILLKVGLLRKAGCDAYPEATAAISSELGIEFDVLLSDSDPAGTLAEHYGFDEPQLEKFAELLYVLARGDSDTARRRRMASTAMHIYSRLEGSAKCCFYDRYYIMQELREYL